MRVNFHTITGSTLACMPTIGVAELAHSQELLHAVFGHLSDWVETDMYATHCHHKSARVPSLDYLSEMCWIHKISYKISNYGIKKKLLVLKQFLNLEYLLLETLCFGRELWCFLWCVPIAIKGHQCVEQITWCGSHIFASILELCKHPTWNVPLVSGTLLWQMPSGSIRHSIPYPRNSDFHVVPSEIWMFQTNVGPTVNSKTRSGTQTSCWAHLSGTSHYHPQ